MNDLEYGYARCSTNESKQDIDRQVRELKAAGAKEVYLEYEHGDAVVKQQLSELLSKVEAGDEILTLEVARLARSTKQLCEIIELVKEKRLKLSIVGSITVDCRDGQIDPMSNAFIQMSGVFAELELGIIRARVKSGMANAKAKGKQIGRRATTSEDIPAAFYRYYPQFANGSINLSEFARLACLSRNSVYKYLKIVEEK